MANTNKIVDFLNGSMESGNISQASLMVRFRDRDNPKLGKYLSENAKTVNPLSAFCENFINRAVNEKFAGGKKDVLPSKMVNEIAGYSMANLEKEFPNTLSWASKRLQAMFTTEITDNQLASGIKAMLKTSIAFHSSALANVYKIKGEKIDLSEYLDKQSFEAFVAVKNAKAAKPRSAKAAAAVAATA